jgi:predicted transcriptional regulator
MRTKSASSRVVVVNFKASNDEVIALNKLAKDLQMTRSGALRQAIELLQMQAAKSVA